MYFETPGKENTKKTIELATKRALELGIKHLVLASTTGYTALECLSLDFQMVCVTHHSGYKDPGVNELSKEIRDSLEEKGMKVFTSTHLFAGVDRAIRFMQEGMYPAEIVAHSLKMLGKGVKVGVEIAVMALDAGLIPYGEKILAIGGTGRGADTALVITPDHSPYLFNTKIHEIICKPRDF